MSLQKEVNNAVRPLSNLSTRSLLFHFSSFWPILLLMNIVLMSPKLSINSNCESLSNYYKWALRWEERKHSCQTWTDLGTSQPACKLIPELSACLIWWAVSVVPWLTAYGNGSSKIVHILSMHSHNIRVWSHPQVLIPKRVSSYQGLTCMFNISLWLCRLIFTMLRHNAELWSVPPGLQRVYTYTHTENQKRNKCIQMAIWAS